MATVDAMKMANKEMKKQYGKIDIDKIEVSIPKFRQQGRVSTLAPHRVSITIWKT
jgi:hypothetical protein